MGLKHTINYDFKRILPTSSYEVITNGNIFPSLKNYQAVFPEKEKPPKELPIASWAGCAHISSTGAPGKEEGLAPADRAYNLPSFTLPVF